MRHHAVDCLALFNSEQARLRAINEPTAPSEEDHLPLIATYTPVALATEVEIPLADGYEFFEIRWAGVGNTGGNNWTMTLTPSYDGVTWDEDDSYKDVSNGTAGAEQGGFCALMPGTTTTRLWLGGDSGNTLTGVAVKVKLHVLNSGFVDGTFDGTGKIWLHGIAS